MYNINRYSRALELDKVLKMLSEQCGCDDSKKLAAELCPVDDIYIANALMKKTEDAAALSIRYGSPSLRGLKNCKDAITKANKGSNLSLRELIDITGVLRNIRGFYDWRKRCENITTSLDELFDRLRPNKGLEELLTTSIISEEEIADNASDELYQIRRKISTEQRKIREKLDNMIKSPAQQKYLQEPIITMRNGRFVVPVKIEYRGEIKGLVHDSSASGATVFVEPLSVVEANNEIRILKSKEEQEIERIIYALSAKVGNYAD
ncbi:MAG: endonuclease MutS2, partial [Oscillospiraceae bacterium]